MMDLDTVDACQWEALMGKSRSGHPGQTPSGPMRVKPATDAQATHSDAAHEAASADHRSI